MTKLNERDREVLGELDAACRNYLETTGKDWVQPMDCGGSDSTDHSYRLSKLVRLGLAQSKQRHGPEPAEGESEGRRLFRGRGSKSYRITEAGRKALEDTQ